MIDTAETVSFVVVPLVLVAAGLAVCSAHIPWLRDLTGAAPLQPEDRDQDDFYVLSRGDATLSAVHADAAANMAAAVRAMAAGRRLELPPAPAADSGSGAGTGGETR